MLKNEWSARRDEILKEQLEKIRAGKAKREIEDEQEVEQLLTRKLPFEMLARDWFENQQVRQFRWFATCVSIFGEIR